MATSTKKEPVPSCYDSMEKWFYNDTTRGRSCNLQFNSTILRDTILCLVYDTTRNINWNIIADSICQKIKIDCNKSGFPILITNTKNPNNNTWETRWGKTIVLKTCL